MFVLLSFLVVVLFVYLFLNITWGGGGGGGLRFPLFLLFYLYIFLVCIYLPVGKISPAPTIFKRTRFDFACTLFLQRHVSRYTHARQPPRK